MLYICVRRTVEWRDEEAFRAQLKPAFAPKVAAWNEAFTMPFHEFRHRVREIARTNLATVRGASCAAWDDIPEGALVVPIDDDDWLAPGVGEALAAARDPQALGYYWTSSYLEVPMHLRHRLRLLRQRLFRRWFRPHWTCSSNNYAFVKTAEMGTGLLKHSHASPWFDGPGAALVRQIEGRLSVQNRTLASITSLAYGRPSIGRPELIRKYQAYQQLYSKPVPSGIAWCRPYVDRMRDLMRELRLRAR